MKAITITILIAMMVLFGISYPPNVTKAEVVKIETPLNVLQHNEAVFEQSKISNDYKAKLVTEKLRMIDSLNKK